MNPAPEIDMAKVNRTVQRGLARCRRSAAPVVALAQFLEELRAEGTWHEASIRQVESPIRHVLARIVVREQDEEMLD